MIQAVGMWAADILQNLPFLAVLRREVAAYALVNAAHILCLALLIGAIVPLDLGIVRAPGFDWAALSENGLRRMAIAGFCGMVLTGSYLFAVRPLDYLVNNAFLIKIAVIAVAGVNALLFSLLRRQSIRRAQAGASLVMWLTILLSGRWIGFV